MQTASLKELLKYIWGFIAQRTESHLGRREVLLLTLAQFSSLAHNLELTCSAA